MAGNAADGTDQVSTSTAAPPDGVRDQHRHRVVAAGHAATGSRRGRRSGRAGPAAVGEVDVARLTLEVVADDDQVVRRRIPVCGPSR